MGDLNFSAKIPSLKTCSEIFPFWILTGAERILIFFLVNHAPLGGNAGPCASEPPHRNQKNVVALARFKRRLKSKDLQGLDHSPPFGTEQPGLRQGIHDRDGALTPSDPQGYPTRDFIGQGF